MSSAVLHPLFETPLPRGWQLTNVDAIKSPEKSACVAGPFGSNISSKFFVESGVPIIRGGNLRDDLTRFVPSGFAFVSEEQALKYKAQHVRAGDLVFTCWGTIGQVGLIPTDGPFPAYIISNKQLKLRADTAVADPLYLFYYFASPQMVGHVRGKGIGAAVPGINLGILKELPVVLPSMRDQQRIVKILSAYDDLIENCERRIRVLDEMARALYREWFLLFRYPGHQKTPLVDSALGRIPNGWTVQPLGEVALLTMGLSPKGDTYNTDGDGTPLINGPVEFGEHLPVKVKWTTAPSKLCKEGDLIVCVRGSTTGKHVKSDGQYCLGRGVCAVGSHYQCFVDLLFKSELPRLLAQTSGSTFPSWTGPQLQSHPVVSPPKDLLTGFEALARPMSDLVLRMSRQIDNLRRSRDLLLPRLLSGQLSVEDAA